MLVLESVTDNDMDEVIETWLFENVGRRQYHNRHWKNGEWRLVKSNRHYDEKTNENRNSVFVEFKNTADLIHFRMRWYQGWEVFEDDDEN